MLKLPMIGVDSYRLSIHWLMSQTTSLPGGYDLGIKQEPRGNRRVPVTHERVWHREQLILERPDTDDRADPERLSQTFLEQINTNQPFREVAQFLEGITYLHLVPQLLRYADGIQGRMLERDPFGQGFLSRTAHTPEATRRRRLAQIEEALKIAVPQLQQLQFVRDDATGQPHLQALYSHWRPNAGWQQEDQFSDGTLRLIGFLWSLLDADSLLLLEEPELSLNSGIVSQLAPIIHRMQRTRRRQVMISTHSEALLTDPGIDGREVLLLTPASEGTEAQLASDVDDLRRLLTDGFSVGELVPDRTRPAKHRADCLAEMNRDIALLAVDNWPPSASPGSSQCCVTHRVARTIASTICGAPD